MKTLLLGFDAFDPGVAERLMAQGRLPNLAKYLREDGYARFAVANPPQSEVSWTSIATGLNPGEHGIFDFVHRDAASYSLYVSLLPTRRGLAGTHFAPPFSAETIFDRAARQGFPATALWWPATFPARLGSPVRTLPGLGAPDIHGRLGVGALFTTEPGQANEKWKTSVEALNERGRARYAGRLRGPARKTRTGIQEAFVGFELELSADRSARLRIGKQVVELEQGTWSAILEIPFRTGLFYTLQAVTRVILTSTRPVVNLYFLPLQIHPLHTPWPYATPRGFVKQAWETCGPFLTLGWPQDTFGLEDGCISDNQFLDLCQAICDARQRILFLCLRDFREGLLASVFDSLDRIQHMFWRDRPDIVEQWYEQLDGLVSRVELALQPHGSDHTKIVVVSDHGFANFNFKVHLNRWLVEQGFLTPQTEAAASNLKQVDWSRSQAYTIGLNSLYLNLEGREGQGCVAPDQVDALTQRLRDALLAWRAPNGQPVVNRVWAREETLTGALAVYGPDLLVGYAPGYRASAQTGLGAWGETRLEPNHDHWGADHCFDPAAVPGVLFCNQGLRDFPSPSYQDIPWLTIGEGPDRGRSAPPPSLADQTYDAEEEKAVEERLKSLGYL